MTPNQKYYRVVEKNIGKNVKFEPNGYYEAIDADGYPIMKYDIFKLSDVEEVAASKSVGGAVMGLYSMFRYHGKSPNIFYVYEINESPDVDISHWDYGDFAFLQEVRYRRPVKGKYIGKIVITDDLKKRLDAFYNLQGLDPYDEPDEESLDIVQDTNYDELLANVKHSIHEEIRAKDAYDDLYAIKSVINGKRDVAFVDLTKQIIEKFKLEKHHVRVIPVRLTSRNTIMSIIYRDRAKAERLYVIAKSHGGFLKDRTPEEAREIGELLGYIKNDIDEYILNHYGVIPLIFKPPLRTDTPDDYDDLHEINKKENLEGLNKKIIEVVKDEKGNDVKICTVNGAFVKGTNPGLGLIQFVEGGHHYVDSYPGYKENIPEDELWVDEVFYTTPENFKGIVGHEFKERNNMKYHKMSYDAAHDLSNKAEKKFRSEKEVVTESFQFNKMFDLMKRII